MNKDKRIIVRMDEETAALLRRLADAEKETISNYLRRLIRAQENKAADRQTHVKRRVG